MPIAPPAQAVIDKPFWLARLTRPIFFFAAILTLAGVYLALPGPDRGLS